MRPPLPVAALAAFGAMVLSASCASPLDHDRWTTGHFGKGKVIAIDVIDTGPSSLVLAAYADVEDRTSAVLDLTGSEHWRCGGGFRTHPTGTAISGDNQNLPYFITAGALDAKIHFFVPAGSYTATVRIPAANASVSAGAGLSQGTAPDSQTGLEKHDPGCARVADSAAQQKALTTSYLKGIQVLVSRLGKSNLKTIAQRAQASVSRANQAANPAVMRSNYDAAITGLRTLADATRAEFPNPPADLMEAIDNAIALLAQTGLH